MPKIKYVDKKFRDKSLELIDKINEVIDEYTAQGYSLTLRQCYYQLVARGIIENNQKVYKTTGNLINDARLAGLIDWNAIEDRTRNLQTLSHWENPQQIIMSAASQFRRDVWKHQDYYVEVWVEKEALANVVGRIANELDVSYFCCRGYVSQSEMWASANRIRTNVLEFYDEDEGNRVKTQTEDEREVMYNIANDWDNVYGEYNDIPFI